MAGIGQQAIPAKRAAADQAQQRSGIEGAPLHRVQGFIDQLRVADQHHVAAGVQMGVHARRHAAGAVRGGHADVVGEHHATEAELAAQDVLIQRGE